MDEDGRTDRFERFALTADSLLVNANIHALKALFTEGAVSAFEDLSPTVSGRMFAVMLRIAKHPAFVRATGTDFLYSFLITFCDALSKPQAASLLKLISETHQSVADDLTIYAMADFVGSVAPNHDGFGLLKVMSRAGNARRRECSLIGMYRLWEAASDGALRSEVEAALRRHLKDPGKGVRKEAERILLLIRRRKAGKP